MTKEQWLEEFEKELDEWLATEDHLYECIGYSEGCACCLDEKHGIYGGAGREWVKAFIKKTREEAYTKGWNDCVDQMCEQDLKRGLI